MKLDNTSILYLVVALACLIITVYLQQTNKDRRQVILSGACFGLMLIMFISNSYNTTNTINTNSGNNLYEKLFNQPLPEKKSTDSDVEYYIDDNMEQNVDKIVGGSSSSTKEETLDDAFRPLIDPSKMENQNIYEAKNVQLTADQLLPSTDNEWGQLQSLVDVGLKDQNFLTPRSTGINTIAQSHKNPCYDLRGSITNPKVGHMPWGNSSIDEDAFNNQLQINMKLG